MEYYNQNIFMCKYSEETVTTHGTPPSSLAPSPSTTTRSATSTTTSALTSTIITSTELESTSNIPTTVVINFVHEKCVVLEFVILGAVSVPLELQERGFAHLLPDFL